MNTWDCGGVPVWVERSDVLPLVDIEIVVRGGAMSDPPGLAGLSHAMLRSMRRGTASLSAEAVEEKVELLGASLSTSVRSTSLRIGATVIRRNLEPFLELLFALLFEPAFREADVDQVCREMLADLHESLDSDSTLAWRAFRSGLFGRHRLGRPASGDLASIERISTDAVRAHHQRQVHPAQLLIGLAGDVDDQAEGWLARRLERHRTGRADDSGRADDTEILEPPASVGRVVVVDKPGRSQAQLVVGALGASIKDADFYDLWVANAAFGGTFTGRLVEEVRTRRGYSYSVGSRLSADRHRDSWAMWSDPSAEQCLDCLELELDLFRDWVERGPDAEEIDRTKLFLVRGHAFERETPSRRLEPVIDAELFGVPIPWLRDVPERVAQVSHKGVSEALHRRFDAQVPTVAVVATASDALLQRLGRLGLGEVRVMPYRTLAG